MQSLLRVHGLHFAFESNDAQRLCATMASMKQMTVEQCRNLIPADVEPSLGDEEIEGLLDMVYDLAELVFDAFSSLQTVDQALFDPPGDVVQRFTEGPFQPAPMRKGKEKTS